MVYTIENSYLSVAVSTCGAELQSILGRNGLEYVWQGDPAYWAMRSPNPFPYVSGLKNQVYRVREKEYRMLPFGLVKDREFRAIETGPEHLVLELTADEDILRYYPWKFVLRYIYKLKDNTLFYKISVDNCSNEMMYFGFCGHTAFNVPLNPEKELEYKDYYLEFSRPSKPMRVGMSGRFRDYFLKSYELEDDRRIRLSHKLFEKEAIFLAYTAKEITLKTDLDSHGVTVRFPDLRYIGFFHTYGTDAPFLCIEPWSTMVGRYDEIEDLACQPDAVQLSGGARYENEWSITLF